MTGELKSGQLTGKGGTANCRVRLDADGAPYIIEVIPPLPDGEYQLVVNKLPFSVRQINSEWLSADESE
jgi:hypothetical protein